MKNTHSSPFKRLILRAVLNDVSPIVARVFSITDDIEITDLHDVFLSMLGWQHDLGFIIRVHGQEFNSYQRRSRGKRLRDFQLRRQEKFLYICNTLDLWEWELRVLDIQDGNVDERDPECLEGRGAAPPELRRTLWLPPHAQTAGSGSTTERSGNHRRFRETLSPGLW
jgi:hypothetical protein